MAFVSNFFTLSDFAKSRLYSSKPDFGDDGFSEFLFYRTYSRVKPNGRNESWADMIIRVVEGCFSIRKDYYLKQYLHWDEDFWQLYSYNFARSMFDMEWLPAGRGLWAMGTDFVYERGSMALNNCGATEIGTDIGADIHWGMDALMCGVGVGFAPIRDDDLKVYLNVNATIPYVIGDTREAWCDSVKILIDSYLHPNVPHPVFDYSKIRKAGLLIKGFGGLSSGPDPLEKLHQRVRTCFKMYIEHEWYDSILLKTDLMNAVGCCVVSGNVRRSAELTQGGLHDQTFINLKNYKKYPHREDIGWMSNNSVYLESDEDYDCLDQIADRIIENGEPGIINLQNLKYGRIGKYNDNVKIDHGKYFNPCFLGSNLALTTSGLKRVDSIQSGDYIWSESGWTKVLKQWSSGVKPVYRYKTTAGYIDCTEDHPVISGNVTKKICDCDNIDTIKGNSYHHITIKDLHPQDIMDGLFHGDGSISGNQNILYIGKDDFDYFTSEVKKYIGSKSGGRDETRYKVQTTYRDLPPTYEREVPDRFLYATPKKICGFLRGLYSANGSIVLKRVTLKAASFKTINAVQIMLSSLGISSYYTTNKPHLVQFRNGIYECKESYDLNIIQKDDIAKFAECIGFIHEDKTDRLNKALQKAETRNQKSNYEIVSKEYLGEYEVFDITVDNRTHTFWCNGFNVHNCAEQVLENKELCNLVETFPTKCKDIGTWYKACEYATVYASTCALLPTHRPETNSVMFKNRRIGVSIADITPWIQSEGRNRVIKYLREGYRTVRRTNSWVNGEAGVPDSIRVTTVKPGGTVPKVARVVSGVMYPNFHYMIRRVRVAANSPIVPILKEANVPFEKDISSDNTLIFSFPIIQDGAPTSYEVGLWTQAINVMMLQREWSDNAVSNTLNFKPKWIKIQELALKNISELRADIDPKVFDYSDKYENKEYKVEINRTFNSLVLYKFNPNHEEDLILDVLSAIAPHIKSISMLPQTYQGVYKQSPEEGITRQEYLKLKSKIKPLDWSMLSNAEALSESYCTSDRCELPVK